jgi:hypothetical protein
LSFSKAVGVRKSHVVASCRYPVMAAVVEHAEPAHETVPATLENLNWQAEAALFRVKMNV